MNDVPIRGSLAPHVGKPGMTAHEMQNLARQAWQQRRVVIIWPDQLADWSERAFVEAIANREYGAKGGS